MKGSKSKMVEKFFNRESNEDYSNVILRSKRKISKNKITLFFFFFLSIARRKFRG